MTQDGGTRAGRFMAKWIAAEKARAGLRHAAVCPNMTEMIKESSLKQACSCWFASFNGLATSGTNLHPPGRCRVAFFWRYVCFVFCFVFVFFAFFL